MSKELLNEAERFLLHNWDEARLLEASMEAVRAKYEAVFQRIANAVTEAHPELDAKAVYPTQFWGSGSISFGRKWWPASNSGFPLAIWNLRLENLASEEADAPSATIYVAAKTARKCDIDIDEAKDRLLITAQHLLTSEDFQKTLKGDSNDVLLRLSSPSKSELLALLADGDGQKFVEAFVRLFDLMARFVPAIDKLFEKQSASAQGGGQSAQHPI